MDGFGSFCRASRSGLAQSRPCHSAAPPISHPAAHPAKIAVPPKGVMLDTPEHIQVHAQQINIQAVLTHAMPPGNITEITPEERQVLAGWIADGAKAE